MSPTRGTVVLVPFPFTDLKAAKRRPALVVSPEGYHPEDVVLCAITSRLPGRPSSHEVSLAANDMENERLPRSSVVLIGKLFTTHHDLILGEVGRVREHKLAEVLTKLRNFFS